MLLFMVDGFFWKVVIYIISFLEGTGNNMTILLAATVCGSEEWSRHYDLDMVDQPILSEIL